MKELDYNASSSYMSTADQDHQVTRIIVITLLALGTPVTILLNVIVFLACKSMKRVQAHYLVMNIAVADFFVGVVSNTTLLAGIASNLADPHNSHIVADKWNTPCHVVGPFSTLFIYASYLTLAIIALDRCLVVAYGIRYKTLVTMRVIKVEIAISWTASALLAFVGPQVFGVTQFIYSFYPPESMCVVVTREARIDAHEAMQGYRPERSAGLTNSLHKTIRDPKFSIMESILSMYLPSIILISSSIILIVLLYIRKMNTKSQIVRRSCQTVLLMIAGYLVCSTPYAITGLPILKPHITPDQYLIFRYLLQVHCMFTPLIYLYRNRKFRRNVVQGASLRKSESDKPSPKSLFYYSFIIKLKR